MSEGNPKRRGLTLPGFAAVAALGFSLLLAAQAPRQVPANLAPAAEARDFSGVWEMPPDAFGNYEHSFTKDELPMTPWATKQYAAAKPSVGPKMVGIREMNDPFYRCLPPGVPRIYLHPFAMEIVQTPTEVIQLFEYDHLVRHIYTDGRQHNDPDPTFMGDAIGHWEGDTLVVDSIGFNDKTWLDRVGHPHSDQMHIVERFRRADARTIEMNMTIEDPVAYTQPIQKHMIFRLQPTWKIQEHVCADDADFLEFDKKENQPNK
jgi:hypothetical protein